MTEQPDPVLTDEQIARLGEAFRDAIAGDDDTALEEAMNAIDAENADAAANE